MFPLFSVLFPLCSQFNSDKQRTFPVFYDLRPSQEMKIEKISRSPWTYWEQEGQWERVRLLRSFGVPSKD